MLPGRRAMSSPQRSPVSISTRIISRQRLGTSLMSRSNSSGVGMVRGLRTAFGSSVDAHGLVSRTRSRTARWKIVFSIEWYLRTDAADSPPGRALAIQASTVVGVMDAIGRLPK